MLVPSMNPVRIHVQNVRFLIPRLRPMLMIIVATCAILLSSFFAMQTSQSAWAGHVDEDCSSGQIIRATVTEDAVVDDAIDSKIRLTDNDRFDGHPAWSPDGTKIAFTCSTEFNYDIYVINAADGSGLTTSSDHTGFDSSADWSTNTSPPTGGTAAENDLTTSSSNVTEASGLPPTS